MRKVQVGILIFVLFMDFASRTGILSYLYDHRYDFAQSTGFISEVPITECRASFFTDHILIPKADPDKSALVASTVFESTVYVSVSISVLPVSSVTNESISTRIYLTPAYGSPLIDIFQPPRV